jgi:outer membrane protein assembly factor BamB
MKTLLLLTLVVLSAFGKPGDLRWKFQANGAIRSSPALGTNGWIIFGTLSGSAYAIDPRTQETKWRTVLGREVLYPPPASATMELC